MRHITIGGRQLPIKATIGVNATINEEWAKACQRAELEARAEGLKAGLDDDALEKLAAAHRASASKAWMTSERNSVWTVCLLINAAVESEQVLHHHDISRSLPCYPMTVEWLTANATEPELQGTETREAITEEFLECNGVTGEKKHEAGMVLALMKRLTSTL